ncbi:hypothetical protein U1707_00070 [Sphingomonas sp. PB2P12]
MMGLDGCLRAILLHGLSIELDTDPELVDDPMADDVFGHPSPLMV